jgi:8-oxo-dGTP pyrophosphatase MutT (NUDIX family)
LTKRASHLKHHPGQIALPGGKVDAGDAGVAGRRPARGAGGDRLDPANVDLLAELADP